MEIDSKLSTLSESVLADLYASREKVVMLNAVKPAAGSRGTEFQRDWSSTTHIIEEVHQAMRISSERIADLEDRLAAVIRQAKDEIAQLTIRAESAEKQLGEVEAELTDTRFRADDAESWLERIHSQIVTSFTPILNPGAGDFNAVSPRADRARS